MIPPHEIRDRRTLVTFRCSLVSIATLGLILTAGCDEEEQSAHTAAELREIAALQRRQAENLTHQQAEIASGSRELVAADASARAEWAKLQNEIELTRHELVQEQAAIRSGMDRLEAERKQIVRERRLDSLTSGALTALGAILGSLVPLLLALWLVRTHHRDTPIGGFDELLIDDLARRYDDRVKLPHSAAANPTAGRLRPKPLPLDARPFTEPEN